jgi:hypothetical protein
MVNDRFARTFERAEEVIALAVRLATDATQTNRVEGDRIKAELVEVEAEQARLVELLMDRAVPDVVKQSVNRKAAEVEARRVALVSSLDGLREGANQNTEALASIVRETFAKARKNLLEVATPEEMNRLVDRFVGPMTLAADGTVSAKKMPVTEATGIVQAPTRCIAGGRFVRECIKLAVRVRLRPAD